MNLKMGSYLVRVSDMSSLQTPTVEDVLALGSGHSIVVPAEFEDENGHVNVVRYYSLHIEAGDEHFRSLGFDDNYRTRTGHSIFSVDHYVRFHDESLVGDELSVHLRLLGVGDKAVHGQTITVNLTRGTVANTMEFVELHVDLTTRRTTPMPASFADPLRTLAQQHDALPWGLPLAGPLGVR